MTDARSQLLVDLLQEICRDEQQELDQDALAELEIPTKGGGHVDFPTVLLSR